MVDTSRYPVDWPKISKRIRERDGHRCRWCGAGERLFDLETGKPVRLTTMHLDWDAMNCVEWNLVTASRPCHAAYDAPERVAGTATARWWQQLEAGQIEMFFDEH